MLGVLGWLLSLKNLVRCHNAAGGSGKLGCNAAVEGTLKVLPFRRGVHKCGALTFIPLFCIEIVILPLFFLTL